MWEQDDLETVEISSQRVYRLLRQQIIGGELKPGAPLVRRTVARELGVSPIPVLEALHLLARDGLVERVALQKARVRSMSMDLVREDLVLREALESQAARLLARRAASAANPEDLETPKNPVQAEDLEVAELYRQADAVDAAMAKRQSGDEAAMIAHARLHLHLAQLSGCAALFQELRRVWQRRMMQAAWLGSIRKAMPRQWHRRLIDAILSGDEERADAAARYHVRRSPAERQQVLKEQAQALAQLQRQWEGAGPSKGPGR